MLGDEHFAAREAVVHLVHSTLGEFPVQNVVPKLSGTPGRVSRLGPELGQDNDDVYGRLLGIGADELAKLKSRGVV
jgi:formyl-CoA transferase